MWWFGVGCLRGDLCIRELAVAGVFNLEGFRVDFLVLVLVRLMVLDL